MREEAIPEFGTLAAETQVDQLTRAVAALQDAIERNEAHWQRLDARLETQYQAILDLRQALDER